MKHTAFILLAIASAFAGCGPSITSFTVDKRVITEQDTLRPHWDVSGEPSLSMYFLPSGGSEGGGTAAASGARNLVLSLTVTKGGKTVQDSIVILILPEQARDSITFKSRLSGDTLIAGGDLSAATWGSNFTPAEAWQTMNRAITVLHAGKTVLLAAGGLHSPDFAGLANSGAWEFRTLLTPEEKADRSLIPRFLRIQLTLQPMRK